MLLLLLVVMAQLHVEIIQSRLPTFKYQMVLVEIEGKGTKDRESPSKVEEKLNHIIEV